MILNEILKRDHLLKWKPAGIIRLCRCEVTDTKYGKKYEKKALFGSSSYFPLGKATLAFCLQEKSRIIMSWKERSTRNKEKVL